jgi:rRNA maturation RNase YbeY
MSELVLRNRQRARRVDLSLLRRIARLLLTELVGMREYKLGVYLVGVREMARIHETFLNHAGSTDVITFDYGESEPTPGPNTVELSSGCRPNRRVNLNLNLNRQSLSQSKIKSKSRIKRPAPTLNSMAVGAGRGSTVVQKGLHGEIFICLDETVAQAGQFGTAWQSELVRYLVHGVLHLCGHDDLKPSARRLMKRQENRLLRELNRRFLFRRLARKPRFAAAKSSASNSDTSRGRKALRSRQS